MQVDEFQHARSTGKCLTYDVKVTGTRYTISLAGRQLRDASNSLPPESAGAAEAMRAYAIRDIEQLRGMNEE